MNYDGEQLLTAKAPEVDARCTHRDCLRGNNKGEYKLAGYCTNCGTEPIVGVFTVGHEAGSGVLGRKCPVCGCKRLGWRGIAPVT